jgi:hypothetical protein
MTQRILMPAVMAFVAMLFPGDALVAEHLTVPGAREIASPAVAPPPVSSPDSPSHQGAGRDGAVGQRG